MTVYLSCDAPEAVFRYFRARGHEVKKAEKSEVVCGAVSSHPDIYMCRDDVRGITIHGDIHKIGRDYPKNTRYCAVILEKYLICNLKHTAAEILRYADNLHLEKIHVNQGYTKCSCAVVDGRSIITSDEGIFKKLRGYDIDVLKITEGHVLLPGYDYGFIGGASGRVCDEMVFCGDLRAHPDFERICEFIEERGVKVKWFEGVPLTDIGSIIAEDDTE